MCSLTFAEIPSFLIKTTSTKIHRLHLIPLQSTLNPQTCGNDGSRPGRDGRYSEHKVVVSFACLGFSHDSFNGFRSCTGLSRKDVPTRSFTARTIPPRPTNNSTMTPSGHFPRLLSSLLTMTTSPTFRVPSLPSPLQLWRSLSADKYS